MAGIRGSGNDFRRIAAIGQADAVPAALRTEEAVP